MRRLVNYIRSNVNSVKVRDYLLSEVVYNYFQENGLKDADYLLAVCWNEVSDTSKMVKIKQLVDRWRKLSPGLPLRIFLYRNSNGKALYLKDLWGKFLYHICLGLLAMEEWIKRFRLSGKNLSKSIKIRIFFLLLFAWDLPNGWDK